MLKLLSITWCLFQGAQEGPRPSRETVEIPETGVKFDLVSLPGGKATIGSPDGSKDRELDLKPFKIAALEVTWAEFRAYRDNWRTQKLDGVTRPSQMDSFFSDFGIPPEFLKPDRPLINARWHLAIAYCDWLSRKTGAYFRLPTEAEWEYAARAGGAEPSPEVLNRVAWYKKTSGERTHAGGEGESNAFGLKDMLGNVWEYVLEPMSPPDFGPVVKGGSWSSPAEDLRTSRRQGILPEWYEDDPMLPRSLWWLTSTKDSVGFRVVSAAGAADREERNAYLSRVEVRVTGQKEKQSKDGRRHETFLTVSGEIQNLGNRTLLEVEVRIHCLRANGTPHLLDGDGLALGRPTFSKCWPVLANSYGDATARTPLRAGETRTFTLDVPQSFELEEGASGSFGGTVTAVRFAE